MSEEDETRTHTGLAHYPLKVARLPFRHLSIPFVSFILLRASCRIRTNDPEITNHVLWPTELKRRSTWSGRRGSNPRPPAWKASALSTELLPHVNDLYNTVRGHRWIRTTEGESQQIYSLPHLATLEYARHSISNLKTQPQKHTCIQVVIRTGFKPVTF